MTEQNIHLQYLDLACVQARQSASNAGDAAGAVLVKGDQVVAQSRDRTQELNDPIAISEMDCIRQAGRRNDQSEMVLYSTKYPNMLAAGTILQFSLGGLVVGLPESQSPAIDLLISKQVPVTFVEHADCVALQGGAL